MFSTIAAIISPGAFQVTVSIVESINGLYPVLKWTLSLAGASRCRGGAFGIPPNAFNSNGCMCHLLRNWNEPKAGTRRKNGHLLQQRGEGREQGGRGHEVERDCDEVRWNIPVNVMGVFEISSWLTLLSRRVRTFVTSNWQRSWTPGHPTWLLRIVAWAYIFPCQKVRR